MALTSSLLLLALWGLQHPPAADDYTAESLVAYQQRLLDQAQAPDGSVSLRWKAAFYEWLLWKYHFTPYHQVHTKVNLPRRVGRKPYYRPGADNSTWNGALLAALAYKYGATRSPETLARIEELLEGLRFFQQVTGRAGLAARCVIESDEPASACTHGYRTEDGRQFYFRCSPAKGTYNQLVQGYATLFRIAWDQLPEPVRSTALEDLHKLVVHLVNNDYRIRDIDGNPTPYGNLTPRIGSTGVPFNAQVAYMIVASGHSFPCSNRKHRRPIHNAFRDLRHDHHVYYERPLRSVIYPQHVAASLFIKGMNDRNHVTNAAFTGIALEQYRAETGGRPLDRDFIEQLGATMRWSMSRMQGQKNSLCNFMFAALVQDKRVRRAMIRDDRETAKRQAAQLLREGVEQLTRFPVDRFIYEGYEVQTKTPQWVDQFRPDSYHWKHDPGYRWLRTGGRTSTIVAAVDYLHAYWLLRYYRLDTHPGLTAQYETILR